MSSVGYWIGVVSRSHARVGVKGGFIQLSHGKKAPLQKLGAGDGLLVYSPRESYLDGEPLQAFTAIGRIRSGERSTVYGLHGVFPRCGLKPAWCGLARQRARS